MRRLGRFWNVIFNLNPDDRMAWTNIIGQESVVAQLHQAYERGLAHAYLFHGPHGVGKGLTAKELAKALFCRKSPSRFTACDRCLNCQQVEAETHPDFYHVVKPEEKHDLPVDTIRELTMQLGRSPANGPGKFAIVDDAHDMNEEAANCFLKTLEEPPPGCKLILLATSADLMLPTIRSRCQAIHFSALKDVALCEVLRRHDVPEDRHAMLTAIADGSPGQALALNDDAYQEFLNGISPMIVQPKPDSVSIAQRCMSFIESAGKESVLQRQRSYLVIRLILDQLRRLLHDSVEQPAAENILERIDGCIDAEYRIDRKVQIALVVESLADRLAAPLRN